MISLMSYLYILIMMTMIMLLFPMLLSMSMKKWSEKSTTFECGMNSTLISRKSFSLRFFLLMVLFIIFDTEIILILAIPVLSPWSMKMMLSMLMFMSLLTIGTMYEWIEGSLNWKS